MTIVYDRTKTVVRRHVAPGEAVPLHPEAVGFAGHYDFDIDVLAAYRPTGKGRVERQVLILRDHVLSGRSFSCVEEMDAAFITWVPQRRAQAHRTHQQIIKERAARDHVALKPLPPTRIWWPNDTWPVGKDCLVAFGGNLYSVPARRVRPRQLVEIRATKSQIMLHSTVAASSGETLLATHPRAIGRGARVVEEAHWDGLPTGRGRRTTTGDVLPQPGQGRPLGEEAGSLQALLNRAAATRVEVGRRPLSVYDELTGTRPFTTRPSTRETS
nr:integrase core domain protein [Streptomyces halstedii]